MELGCPPHPWILVLKEIWLPGLRFELITPGVAGFELSFAPIRSEF